MLADAKRAAVEQWTADPCGYDSDHAPGSRLHMEDLDRGLRAHAPWMDEILDYEHASGLRVLDVGCGQGIDMMRYAVAGAHVAGIDITPRHAELARRHLAAMGLDANVVDGDAESMPFADASFDRVSSNGVLHHTPNMPAALREIRRVLGRGGEARVIVYNQRSFHYWLTQVLMQGLVHRQLIEERSMTGVLSRGVERSSIGARPLARVYSPRQLRAMLRDAGFVDVRTTVRHFNVDDTPLTAWAARKVQGLGAQAVLDRIGRIGGWYVIGYGSR
ncbi:MAG TPA: class I SAM-dependent methyltransferase [Solirubrobacteraceae bacterium]|jgi:ubiquinone/menaquinone biosynthesis C-methylase UbiE|nr:class I SAM-dependent methyltransferase [Solirubrobacteraceae bacterium]